MKRYVSGMLLGAGFILLLHYCVLFDVRAPIPAEYWLRDLIIVQRDLLSRVAPPRIIFLGGSSTLFGTDAAQVERDFKQPSFNFGLHAGMRLQDVLACGREQGRSGDIVVLALEYSFFETDSKWTPWQMRQGIAFGLGDFDKQPFDQKLWFLTELTDLQLDLDLLEAKGEEYYHRAALAEREAAMRPPAEILQKFYATHGRGSQFSYSMEDIDDHGNMLNTDHGEVYQGKPASPLRPTHIAPRAANDLRRFLAEMKSRQIRVCFTNVPTMVEGAGMDGWQKSEAAFKADCDRIGAEYVDQRSDLFFPRDLFFNTEFHLNARGRMIRTQQLIKNLRLALSATR